MFKKIIAAVSALAISLGMVVLVAGPASAHHSTITATVQCQSPTTATITWSVQNWNGGKIGKVDSSTDDLVPAGTQFASNQTKTFTQNITTTGTYTLSVTMSWKNGSTWDNTTTNSGSITVKSSDFSACAPDDTDKKITICHATSSDGNPYTENDVSVSSIITVPNGHDTHADDIIPPFTYTEEGVPGSYPGKNWDAYGQWVYGNGSGCSNDVTPAVPTYTDAVCTAEGQAGQGSYTIPSSLGVKYQVKFSSGGTYTDKAPGTYAVAAGTSVWIRAVELSGYNISGTSSWKFDLASLTGSKCVVPTAPTATQAECTAPGQHSQASYTIPSDTGVKYQRWNGSGWTDVSAGAVNVNSFPTQIKIRAVALSTYTIVPGSTTEWTFDFVSPGACTVTVTPAAVTFTQPVCRELGESTEGGYTIPIAQDGVIYTVVVNGNPASNTPGFHALAIGDTVSVLASADSGYALSEGTWSWGPFTVVSPGDCLNEATPADPIFVDAICDVEEPGETTQASYEIVAAEGVTYEVSTDGVTYTTTGAEVGVHNVANGSSIWIRAVAADGYKLVAPGEWKHDFTDPGDCLVEVSVTAATATDQTCVVDQEGAGNYVSGFITIPASDHVTYYIDGVLAAAGDHQVVPGGYQVTAVAEDGYQLTGYTGPWNLTVDQAEACGDLIVFPIVTPVVTFVQESCSAKGTYSLATDEEIPGSIIWTVSGGLPNTEGTHAVATAGTVTITAEPADGFGFSGDVPLLEWNFEFTTATDCDLTTLPLTGGTPAGLLGLAGLLLLGGALIVAARERRVVTED